MNPKRKSTIPRIKNAVEANPADIRMKLLNWFICHNTMRINIKKTESKAVFMNIFFNFEYVITGRDASIINQKGRKRITGTIKKKGILANM
ncbi:MAG: hypothetical protein ABIG42_08780 [bacterium]